MFGLREDACGRPGLDDLAAVHHGDGVGAFGREPEIVSDEQDARPELVRDGVDGVEDAALHGDVERGGRFVGDEQPGSAGEPHGDEGALPHAAGELVRVLRRAGGRVRDAHELQELDGTSPGGLPGGDVVHLERLRDLVADPHQRVEV